MDSKSSKNFAEEIGLRLVGFIDNHFVVELDVERRHLGPAGRVHVGVLCTLLGTAMGMAFVETLPERKRESVATLEMKINFLKATALGTLTACGTLANVTRRTAFVEGVIRNHGGTLVAKGSGTLMMRVNVEP